MLSDVRFKILGQLTEFPAQFEIVSVFSQKTNISRCLVRRGPSGDDERDWITSTFNDHFSEFFQWAWSAAKENVVIPGQKTHDERRNLRVSSFCLDIVD